MWGQTGTKNWPWHFGPDWLTTYNHMQPGPVLKFSAADLSGCGPVLIFLWRMHNAGTETKGEVFKYVTEPNWPPIYEFYGPVRQIKKNVPAQKARWWSGKVPGLPDYHSTTASMYNRAPSCSNIFIWCFFFVCGVYVCVCVSVCEYSFKWLQTRFMWRSVAGSGGDWSMQHKWGWNTFIKVAEIWD